MAHDPTKVPYEKLDEYYHELLQKFKEERGVNTAQAREIERLESERDLAVELARSLFEAGSEVSAALDIARLQRDAAKEALDIVTRQRDALVAREIRRQEAARALCAAGLVSRWNHDGPNVATLQVFGTDPRDGDLTGPFE